MKPDFSKDPIEAAQQRPIFFDTPGMDELVHMLVAMAEEVAVLSERLDNAQALLESKGVLSPAELDNYVPDAATRQQRLAQHQARIARLLSVLQPDVAAD